MASRKWKLLLVREPGGRESTPSTRPMQRSVTSANGYSRRAAPTSTSTSVPVMTPSISFASRATRALTSDGVGVGERERDDGPQRAERGRLGAEAHAVGLAARARGVLAETVVRVALLVAAEHLFERATTPQ